MAISEHSSDRGSADLHRSSTPDLNTGLEILDRENCLALLRGETVGRLGVIADGRPEIFPVNYALDDAGELLLRTGPGTKLSGALHAPVVFEVDHLDPSSGTGWSVVVHGRARLLPPTAGQDLVRRLSDAPVVPNGSGHRHHVLGLATSEMTGRLVTPRRRTTC